MKPCIVSNSKTPQSVSVFGFPSHASGTFVKTCVTLPEMKLLAIDCQSKIQIIFSFIFVSCFLDYFKNSNCFRVTPAFCGDVLEDT